MITTHNVYSGANFAYENEQKTCTATGEFKTENNILTTIGITGKLLIDGKEYNFWAQRDPLGNIQVSGIPVNILPAVADEVSNIVSEVEEIAVAHENEE